MDWEKPGVRVAIGVTATLVIAVAVVIVLQWTGGAKAVSDNAALIGAVIALGGVFTTQLVSIALDDRRARETRRQEDARTQETRRQEDERTKETRRLEDEREQATALQQYFTEMGQLLRQGLRRIRTTGRGVLLESDEEQRLRSLASVQTDRILRGLAPQRKWLLLSFLSASGLIDREAPIIGLRGSDLRRVVLCEYLTIDKSAAREYLGNDANPSTYLSKDNLSAVLRSPDDRLDAFVDVLRDTRLFADLSSYSFRGAHLMKAYLRSVILSGADLSGAYLLDADLIDADLSNALLGGAWLTDAVLLAANLNMANLSRVYAYGAVFVKADLAKADLSQASLTEADLRRANLSGADLSGADLSGADLSGADLSSANLIITSGITSKELEQQAKSLEGATMPTGQKYQDWLKDRESRKEDGDDK